MSVKSQIDRLNAIKNRIRTNLAAQGIAVPADTMLEAMAEQILSVAGYTPEKGVDYWTAADQETIVQQVLTVMGMHILGTVDANNNIILTGELAEGTYTLKYEDAEGNVTEIGTLKTDPGPSYTNWIKHATELDGVTWYNNCGYKTETRYSASTGTETGSNAAAITLSGFIRVNVGDVVRIKNITMKKTSSVANAHHICTFPALSLSGGASRDIASLPTEWQCVWGSDGQLEQFTVPSSANATYIRIQAEYIGADSILTINEPIE